MTALFDDNFIPIDDQARDGERWIVRKGDHYAVAQWCGDFWSFPFDPSGEDKGAARCAVQIDFEPTHYRPKAS